MPADQISACQINISTTSVYLRFKFQKGTTREEYNSVKNITANIKLWQNAEHSTNNLLQLEK